MKYGHILLFLLLIIYGEKFSEVNALRCAKKCSFGPVELGSKHPFQVPCDVIDIDPTTTECTAALALRLSDNLLIGLLDTQPRATNMSSTLEIGLSFSLRSTISMVNYTCTTTDNCDQEFVRESGGSSKWAQLNETKTRAELISLLFDPGFSTKNYTCANNITCQKPYHNCQADFIKKSFTPHLNTTEFDNNFKCIINHVTEIAVFHYFKKPIEEQTTAAYVFCNKNQCNQRETVEQAYNIIQNEFILPLNYSQFIPKK